MGLGEVSVLGLGCARLGSLTEPRSRRESLSLIAAAVNAGITLFDTADIYAQGESERILGEALKSIDACIVTKAGQISSLAKGVPLPLRGAVTSLLAHSSMAARTDRHFFAALSERSGLAGRRGSSLPCRPQARRAGEMRRYFMRRSG